MLPFTSGALTANTQYTLNVAGGAQSASGVALSPPYMATFTTGTAADFRGDLLAQIAGGVPEGVRVFAVPTPAEIAEALRLGRHRLLEHEVRLLLRRHGVAVADLRTRLMVAPADPAPLIIVAATTAGSPGLAELIATFLPFRSTLSLYIPSWATMRSPSAAPFIAC